MISRMFQRGGSLREPPLALPAVRSSLDEGHFTATCSKRDLPYSRAVVFTVRLRNIIAREYNVRKGTSSFLPLLDHVHDDAAVRETDATAGEMLEPRWASYGMVGAGRVESAAHATPCRARINWFHAAEWDLFVKNNKIRR